MKLIVVVSGQAVGVEVLTTADCNAVIRDALKGSGNVGAAAWELRNTAGRLLEPLVQLKAYGVKAGDTLWLSPHAGAGAQGEAQDAAGAPHRGPRGRKQYSGEGGL